MPVKLTMLRAAFLVSGIALIIPPAAALRRMHSHQADGASRSLVPVPQPILHHEEPPSYNDPSKFGGDSVPDASNTPAAVHVQPRGSGFNPNSDEAKVVQKVITDFDEVQRAENVAFDKKLIICRGC